MLFPQKHMLQSVETDIERVNLLNKIIKLLCGLKSMPFFTDLVTSVQAVVVSNFDKCTEPESKDLLRQGVGSLLVSMSDSEAKTLLTQSFNQLTAADNTEFSKE